MDDSDETMSYRAAVGGLVVGFGVMTVWLWLMGTKVWVALLFLLLALLIFIGITRIVCEAGLAAVRAPMTAPDLTMMGLGSQLVGNSGVLDLSLAYIWSADIRVLIMAMCANGLKLIEAVWDKGGRKAPVNLLTHCNAGWLATVDWGTALSPVYQAHDAGIPVHVWVDETRPRNQGAGLTAWELGQHGVPHSVIADNVGGHLMQHGQVDLCITGTDRTTATGDVCNKIGTYLKALAAHDNGVPFYVALPGPTIDWTVGDGLAEIPIEQRDGRELTEVTGRTAEGAIATVRITPENSPATNYAFDVTPARLVSGLLTERGLCPASRDGLLGLYPERRR